MPEFPAGFVPKTQHEVGEAAQTEKRVFHEKSNLRPCDVLSRHAVLGGVGAGNATDRLDNATSVMHEIMGMPDKGIPEEVLQHAKCIAI